MGRVKVNLTSGSVVDKPLVTAFKGTNGDYLVLDNEANGSMGLPIICVSKYANGIVSKISDPTEWSSVKENLKTIISGTNLPYFDVPENLSGDQDFFTQLTLPVASFDILKNTYAPVASVPAEPAAVAQDIEPASTAPISMDLGMPVISDAPVMPETPAAPVADVSVAPAIPEVPTIEMPTIPDVTPMQDTAVMNTETPTQTISDISAAPGVPAMPDFGTSTDNSPFTMNIPSMNEAPAASETSIPSVAPAPISMPEITPAEPITNDVPVVEQSNVEVDFSDIKANFMAACENMIDALIEKLKNIK